FAQTLTRQQSDDLVHRLSAALNEWGMTVFAAEEKASGRFIGMIGLMPVSAKLPIAPAVELGWRLASDVWGQGLATEGARAALRAGFEDYGLERQLAFTTPRNKASRRVMEKVGLLRNMAVDFDHPDISSGHPSRRQIVYEVDRDTWLSSPIAAVSR
ncbi:MAG: GNAT family N-acetyltransferase, partial [Alphaproteobacteria bacterium]